jgi:hypothetical protein
MSRLIPSKRFIASLVAAFAIVAGASAESYAQTGKVRLNIVKSGSVVGQGGGTGTLTFRAILLASATATTFAGRRSIIRVSQGRFVPYTSDQ